MALLAALASGHVAVAGGLFSRPAEHPNAVLLGLIRANVDAYVGGVIDRSLWPNPDYMWQELREGHDEDVAKIILAETYGVFTDILRQTDKYWRAEYVLANATGAGVVEMPQEPEGYHLRYMAGALAKEVVLALLDREEVFSSDLPDGFSSGDKPSSETSRVFPNAGEVEEGKDMFTLARELGIEIPRELAEFEGIPSE